MNTTVRISVLMVFLMGICTGTALFAHHSFAAFDVQDTETLRGVVEEVQWRNPHVWIQVMVEEASGNEVEWSIETGSPSSLVRQGWKTTSVKPGDQITVTMHPLRDGRPGGYLVTVRMADGTTIGGDPAGEPDR